MLYIDILDYRYCFNSNKILVNNTIIIDDTVSIVNNYNYIGGRCNNIFYKLYKIKVKELFNFNLLENFRYFKFANKELVILELYGTLELSENLCYLYTGNKFILCDYKVYKINNFNFNHFIKNSKYNEIIRCLRGY